MKISKMSYAIAIILAIVAGFAVFIYQTSADQRALAGKQAVTVLVATADIPKGTPLQAIQGNAFASLQTFPISSVPAESLTGYEDLDPMMVALHGIARGQILTSLSFGDAIDAAENILIPDGKVAVTVELGDAARVSGFLVPGSEVSVLYTFTNADSKQSVTRVMLARVSVLAVGQTSSAAADANATGQPSLITLALTQKEAEQIVLAQQTGAISFALLGDDSVVVPDGGTSESGIRG